VARNKRHVEQKIKKEEIELVAMQLLKEQGYDNTSMAKIAKAAGVAPNTIYWYYENKDDVLIAVLNRVVAQAMVAVLALQNEPLKERVLKLIEQVESAGSLMTDVHSRVSHSNTVKEWHDRFHSMVEQLSISEMIRAGLDRSEAALDAKMLIYVIEGLLAHPHDLAERDLIVNQALKRIFN
jgi:TetR/AcrR family transcriptional regulator of autoinduction and epiphytic fitness